MGGTTGKICKASFIFILFGHQHFKSPVISWAEGHVTFTYLKWHQEKPALVYISRSD